MGLFVRTPRYDRSRILAKAAHARAKKRRKKAIALYRRVLAVEPNNAELHAKLAPLLAQTGQRFDAWVSFQTIAQAYLRAGRRDKALAVYREAAGCLPREVQVWRAIARLEFAQGRQGDAVEALLQGSRQFRSRRSRPEAIHLLRQARRIAEWHFEAVYELARLLARSGQHDETRLLLEGLETRSSGESLRRVYAAQFRLDGDLRYAWLWLRAALRTEAEASYG